MTKKISELQELAAKAKYASFITKAEDINGGKFFMSKIEDFEPAMVKSAVEMLSDKLGDSVIILVSVKKDGLFVMVKISENFVQKGINAGKIVAEITAACGGKGGGRPNFAQGAAKDASHIDSVLKKVDAEIKSQVSQLNNN